jgi:hypothetical protein
LRGIDGEEADAPNDRRPSRAAYASWLGHATLRGMVNVLLTVALLASATIAISHVINRAFIAPHYDCVLNLLAFGCQAIVAVCSMHGQHWS